MNKILNHVLRIFNKLVNAIDFGFVTALEDFLEFQCRKIFKKDMFRMPSFEQNVFIMIKYCTVGC